MRCWRIRDRRLIHYNSSCTEWKDCNASKIKQDLDLAHMAAVSFYPKSNPKPNLLHVKHPKIGNNKNTDNSTGGLLLRFSSNQKPGQDTMCSWLKVLTAWGVDRKKNRIYVAIPSNFSYALWNLLNALYDHPDLLTTEGIFRKDSTTVRVKHELCNDILHELVSLEDLKSKYNDIHLLAKSLQYILSNLPSSIFGDQEFEDLLEEVQKYNIELIDHKSVKNTEDEALDSDVANISYDNLLSLKECINDMYLSNELGNKYRHRYGLISLILHLIKQITMNISINRMSCHAMARLFSMCFESKQYMQNMLDPYRSLLLIKILIYHSYYLFPIKKWRMKDIVIAEKQEAITMEKYKELKLTKKEKKNRLKKMSRDPPTNNYNSQLEIHNMDMIIPPPPIDQKEREQEWKDNDQVAENTQFKKQQQDKLKKLVRYQSHDDLDIGNYERKEVDISNLTYNTKNKYHHEAIHTKQNTKLVTRHSDHRLVKHKSFEYDEYDNMDETPDYIRKRSASVPNIPAIKSPSMSTLTGFAIINQNKIQKFSKPCYLNNGIYGEYIYFMCGNKCFRYNITYNQYKLYMNYPNNMVLNDNCGVSMDQNGKRIFVIGGNYEFIEFMNIDSDEKEEKGIEYIWNDKNVKVYCNGNDNMKQQAHYNINKYGNDVEIIFIEGDICELHIIGGGESNYHLRWDEHYNKMIKLYEFDEYFKCIKGHNILYINNEWNKLFKRKMVLFGGCIGDNIYSKQILYCDITENIMKCVWNKLINNISLPISLAYFGAVVYKNIFIIIFGGISENNKILNDIWYLNINTLKWIKSKIKCPTKCMNGWYAILTNDNMIHLFQRYMNGHYTIKITDIISNNELYLAEKEQENMYKMGGHIAQKTTLEISRQKEIFYKTSSTSVGASIDIYNPDTSITPIPTEYNIKQDQKQIEKEVKEEVKEEEKQEILYDTKKKEDIKIDVKPTTKQSLYEKYGISVSPKSTSNDLSERMMQNEIDNERFTCKLKALYDWCAALCGLGGDANSDTQPRNIRVASNSYSDDDKNDSD